MASAETRTRTLQGRVVSDKMDKTITGGGKFLQGFMVDSHTLLMERKLPIILMQA